MTDLQRTVRVDRYGNIERGIEVPHLAANLKCGHRIVLDPTTPDVTVACRKRLGHETPEDEAPHVPVDTRVLAAPYRVVHTQRFAPGGLPAGVDQTITLPHDCENHLDD